MSENTVNTEKTYTEFDVARKITEALREADNQRAQAEREAHQRAMEREALKAEIRAELEMERCSKSPMEEAAEAVAAIAAAGPAAQVVIPQAIRSFSPSIKDGVRELREQFGPLIKELEDERIKQINREVSTAFHAASKAVLNNLISYMERRDIAEAKREAEREERWAKLAIEVIQATKPKTDL